MPKHTKKIFLHFMYIELDIHLIQGVQTQTGQNLTYEIPPIFENKNAI